MQCSFCNSWFHLIWNYPEHENTAVHYVDYTQTRDRLHTEFSRDQSVFESDRPVHEYNLSPFQDYGEQEHKIYLFLSLIQHREHELERNPQFFHIHEFAATSPTLNGVLNRHPNLNLGLNVKFHVVCFDEGAPQSVTGVNKWFLYLQTYHLPVEFPNIHQFETTITFGDKGQQKLEVSAVRRVNIRVPSL